VFVHLIHRQEERVVPGISRCSALEDLVRRSCAVNVREIRSQCRLMVPEQLKLSACDVWTPRHVECYAIWNDANNLSRSDADGHVSSQQQQH